MKLLIDFFPIILFFAAFKLWDIYVATGVTIAATLIQIAWFRYSTGKVETMQWVTLGIVTLFGGATILLQDETFIKWKPTVLYWLMSATLTIGTLVFKKNFIKSLMGAQLDLPDHVWRAMNWGWAIFFAALGVLNLWVAYSFDTSTWVSFKLIGGIGLPVLFLLGQFAYFSRYLKTDTPDA